MRLGEREIKRADLERQRQVLLGRQKAIRMQLNAVDRELIELDKE